MNCTGIKRKKGYALKCLVVLAVTLLLTPKLQAQRYPFYNLSVDDGLIQSQAVCLTQDKAGNLWIGTLGGLSRYDGRNFTNFTVRNGLMNNQVRAVAPDSYGNIWIGTHDGISQYDGKTFKNYPLRQTKTKTKPFQQIQIVQDTAWWRTQGDIYYITRGKQKYFATPGMSGEVSSMLAERGSIWVANHGSLYHLAGGKWDTIRFDLQPEQPAPNIYRIFKTRDGQMLVTSSIGVYRVDKGRFVAHWINATGLSFVNEIGALTEDHSGSLWMSSGSGVIRVDTSILQTYNKRNGLSDNAFSDMFTDNEGNVWMASDGQGVYRFSGTQFTGLDETMGLPSAQVMAIASNKRDSLFIGTYDAGLYIFKDGKVSPLSFPSNPVPAITSLCYTRRGKLWIGTRGRGLWTYENQIFRQYQAPERGFPSNNINSLYMDPHGRLWIGFSDGIITYDNDSFKTIATNIRPVYSFLTIGEDSTLISVDGTLKLYHDTVLSDFVTHTIVDTYAIQCFIVKGRDLWMGSGDNGVIRYNMDSHKALIINKNSGLRSDFIYNIVADAEGNIWVGTGFGIHKIKINEKGEPVISFYGKAQGITGMESNINAVLKLPDESIWFGTTNGALHFQPHTAVVSAAPASIVLQSVKIAGENIIERSWYDSSDNWYGVPYGLRLPYKKNSIAFTFQAITLSGAQQVLYRYHIDGLETPWSDWSPTNSVTYSALPPGKYVFHVQCRSGGEGHIEPELKYEFEIITPFQKTTWFRFSVLIACLLLGILLQYLVTSKKQRRERLLAKLRTEEQGKIRMRTAEDFHDEIGNKLTRINVLTSVLKSKVALTPDTERIVSQIEENTSQLYSGTRDILWSLKPSNDNLYEILHRIRDFGIELYQDTEVNFSFIGTDEKWRNFRLPMDMSRNLIMIFKEALNNCLKYSMAKNVTLEVIIKNKNVLQLVLKDDGIGFDVQSVKKGNGLNNMNTRAGRLNGKLYIDSRKNKGTIINLTFKIPPNK